jgi:hypothetical protein
MSWDEAREAELDEMWSFVGSNTTLKLKPIHFTYCQNPISTGYALDGIIG